MKIIFSIAIQELKKLFYSPIAWLVLIVFSLQVSYGFFDRLDHVVGMIERGGPVLRVASRIFHINYPTRVFEILISNIYIYVPLITMGLFSKEVSSGSFKLLLSSPLSYWQIVLGKYLAMIFYNSILSIVLLLFVLVSTVIFSNFDSVFVISGIIGFFLLLCTYSAIGIFISSLTSYQVVAAIATFAVIALINLIGGLGQDIPVLNDLLYWLSIAGRAEKMVTGLISSADVVYFLLVIAIFLCFTEFKLSSGNKNEPRSRVIFKYGLVLILFVFIGYITSNPRFKLYKDMTASQYMTLTKESQLIAEEMQFDPIIFKTYVNILSDFADRSGLPKYKNVDFRRFEKYTRFIPQLKIEHVYFYDTVTSNPYIYSQNTGLTQEEIAKKVAKSFGLDFNDVLTPEEIRGIVDLSGEDNQYVRVIEFRNRKAFLRMYRDIAHYPKEEEISSALKKVLYKPPLVGFVSGHGERSCSLKSDDNYYYTMFAGFDDRFSLKNDGFDFVEVSLKENNSLNDIDILVIADPKTPFEIGEINSVNNFLDTGKNCLILGDSESSENLKPILDLINISFKEDKLITRGSEYSEDLIFAEIEDEVTNFSRNPQFLRNVKTTKSIPVVLKGAMAMELKDTSNTEFKIFPLLKTKSGTHVIQDNGDTSIEKGGMAVAFGLTRSMKGKQQRLAVVGDADLYSNALYEKRIQKSNELLFVRPLFSWFTYDEFPVINRVPYPPTSDILIKRSGIKWLRAGIMFMVPLLIFLGSAWLLISRRRK